MNNDIIDAYWQAYQAALAPDSPARGTTYTAECFGDSPRLATELGELIASGAKTTTCSALWEWEAESEPLPEVGAVTVILDGDDRPLCIIETIEVSVRPFDQVDAQFAYAEGEGDRSLEYWREAHWRFFTRTLAKIGKEPAEDMPLVCERFRVIYGGKRKNNDE